MIRNLVLPAALLFCTAANALTVDIQVYNHSFCGQNNGALMANVSGGTPPYTIQWSNGPTTAENFGIVPGTYTVTVTDALLDQATDQEVINSLPAHDMQTTNEDGGYCAPEWPYVSFYGGTENGLPPDPASGTYHTPGPYSFDAVGFAESWSEIPDACTWFSYYVVSIDAPVGSNVVVNFTDGAGCPGSFNTT
ncbi:MAG TPA: SprB repeat-containing protein, partial [Flavobacteriales bacterium]|nr:SprB repeat-containing protein [Flavobacteriales bacterium]